jgi:hypothetical protein
MKKKMHQKTLSNGLIVKGKAILIYFSKEVKLAHDIISITSYFDQFFIAVPIVVMVQDENWNNTVLFQTSFSTEISIEKLPDYHELDFFDVESWIKQFEKGKEFYDLIVRRANILLTLDEYKVNPIPIVSNYVRGTEFISVDSDTDFYGNSEQEGLEGVHLAYGQRDVSKPQLSVKLGLSEYDLPYSKQKELEKWIPNFTLYKKSDDEINSVWESLTLSEQVEILERKYRREAYSAKEYYFPYFIRLSGNDDDSYTKYFATEKEMLDEIQYLRLIMPINKEIDIKSRGYVFTN